MKGYFKKQAFDVISPDDDDTEAWLEGIKRGEVFAAELSRPRNYKFLKKFMELIKIGFESWEPGEISNKYGVPEKNIKQFRKDVTILAGYYVQYVRLDGSIATEAKSISFAKMDEDEFAKLYNSAINVILKHVLVNHDRETLDNQVNAIMSFT